MNECKKTERQKVYQKNEGLEEGVAGAEILHSKKVWYNAGEIVAMFFV